MITEEQRKALGITERLPSGPQEATMALRADTVVCSAIGEAFLEVYTRVLQEYNKRLDDVGSWDSLKRRDWLAGRL